MVLRFFSADEDLLLVINLGCDMDHSPAPEPLLGLPRGAKWQVIWSSESVKYGGHGTPPVQPNSLWRLPGESALLLGPARLTSDGDDE
jgi:maltooligosyltrehalose trehalohydrolase